jgi:hypothetical protein
MDREGFDVMGLRISEVREQLVAMVGNTQGEPGEDVLPRAWRCLRFSPRFNAPSFLRAGRASNQKSKPTASLVVHFE